MARTGLVCALAALWPASAARAAVTIRLVNSAGVAGATVAEAERQASRVLLEAGVEVTWRDCGPARCQEDPAPGEFWMHLAL